MILIPRRLLWIHAMPAMNPPMACYGADASINVTIYMLVAIHAWMKAVVDPRLILYLYTLV